MGDKQNSDSGAIICLSAVVDMMKEEGERLAGTAEGLVAYQALVRIKSMADAFDVPLDDIGLANYNPDHLLKQKAA